MGKLILLVFKAIAWIYYFLPVPLKEYKVRSLGWILRLAKLRAPVVWQNLAFAYPSDPPKREALYREAYRHLARLILDIPMLFGPMPRFIRKQGEFEGAHYWREAKKQGKGVIILSSHVGNWEIMASTGAMLEGIDIMIVTKHLKPEWLHQAIEQGRKRCGVLGTYEPRTLKDVLGHLKKNGTVGFVLDQYAGPPVGYRVPVFGVPVGTSTAIAMLAKRTGAAVIPAVNYRKPDGRWVVIFREPLQWIEHPDPSYELAANTAHYAAVLEKDIFDHPDQWLWIHRRFKGDLTPLREGEWTEGRARR